MFGGRRLIPARPPEGALFKEYGRDFARECAADHGLTEDVVREIYRQERREFHMRLAKRLRAAKDNEGAASFDD